MSRSRTVRAVAAALALTAGLSGCSVVAAFTPHVEAEIYDTAKDYAADKTTPVPAPGFLPEDATVIRVDWDNQSGAAILTFTSPTHYKAGSCAGEVPMPKPSIQDSWWPIDALPPNALKCSDGWSGFVIGNQIYAALPATKG